MQGKLGIVKLNLTLEDGFWYRSSKETFASLRNHFPTLVVRMRFSHFFYKNAKKEKQSP